MLYSVTCQRPDGENLYLSKIHRRMERKSAFASRLIIPTLRECLTLLVKSTRFILDPFFPRECPDRLDHQGGTDSMMTKTRKQGQKATAKSPEAEHWSLYR